MATIYENIKRLQQLANYGGNVAMNAKLCRMDIEGRAQDALDIVGAGSRFAQEIEEIKELAADFEQRVTRLNDLLTTVIKSEAERLLRSAG